MANLYFVGLAGGALAGYGESCGFGRQSKPLANVRYPLTLPETGDNISHPSPKEAYTKARFGAPSKFR